MNKRYIDANELLEDAFRLAVRIYQSSFKPDLIAGVWRGGTPVAIAIQEYFEYQSLFPDHIAIRASSYTGIGQRKRAVAIEGLDYIFNNSSADARILFVDDVFDTGNSFRSILEQLALQYGGDVSQRVKIACPWYKPRNNDTNLKPDFYLHETDDWLVFPHEIAGLSMDEIKQGKPEISTIIS